MRDEPKVNRLNITKGETGLTPVSTGEQSWEKAITLSTLGMSIARMKQNEDKKTQNDIKAANRPENKKKSGRMHKEEKEQGTKIMTINLSGSKLYFEYIQEFCKDHILLIQEHWKLKDEVHAWESLARMKGWQGVWEPAKQTEESQEDQEEWLFSHGMVY